MDNSKVEIICREIKAGLDASSARSDFWERLRDNTYNRNTGSGWQPYEGAINTVWNLTQVMIDALSSSVVGSITAADPWVVAIGGDGREEAEKILHFFAEKDGLKEALKEAATVAGWSNRAIIDVVWDAKKRGGPGFRFSVLEPTEVVVYPASATCIEDTKLYGRLIRRRKSQIRQLIDEGFYTNKSATLMRADESQGRETLDSNNPSLETRAVSDEDELVSLYDIIRDENGKYVRYVIAYDSKEILKEEPWAYGYQRCGEFGFKACSRLDGYWPSTSVAYDLEQVQYDLNEANNRLLESLRYNAHPVTYVNGSAQTAQTVLKSEPGGVYEVDTEGMQITSQKVDIGAIPMSIQMYISHAERIARISGMGMGIASPQVSTATEANLVGGGQAASIDDYIETFGAGLIEVVRYMQEALYQARGEWLELYAEHLEIEDVEVLAHPYIWRLMTRSMGSTPTAKMQSAFALWQVAADPESGYDKYELAKRLLDLSEKQGFSNTEGIQRPNDPLALVPWVAAQTGLPPDKVAFALAFAADDESQSVGAMAEPGQLQGLPSMAGMGNTPQAG